MKLTQKNNSSQSQFFQMLFGKKKKNKILMIKIQ